LIAAFNLGLPSVFSIEGLLDRFDTLPKETTCK
jgi:hypothetical protein